MPLQEIPYMYVKREYSRPRQQHFWRFKHNCIAEYFKEGNLGNDLFISFWKEDFFEMLNYLKTTYSLSSSDAIRIYFAIYSEDGKPGVPSRYGNKFTVIFSPAKHQSNPYEGFYDIPNKQEYYTISPIRGWQDKKSKLPLDGSGISVAEEWVKNYKEQGLPLLKNTIDPEPFPLDDDSKNIFYPLLSFLGDEKLNILGMKDEIDHIENISPFYKVKKIRLFFSCYTQNEHNPSKGIIRKHLITAFGLTRDDENGDEVNLDSEDLPDFPQRHQQPPPTILKDRFAINGPGTFDTGTICPPKCNGALLNQ